MRFEMFIVCWCSWCRCFVIVGFWMVIMLFLLVVMILCGCSEKYVGGLSELIGWLW